MCRTPSKCCCLLLWMTMDARCIWLRLAPSPFAYGTRSSSLTLHCSPSSCRARTYLHLDVTVAGELPPQHSIARQLRIHGHKVATPSNTVSIATLPPTNSASVLYCTRTRPSAFTASMRLSHRLNGSSAASHWKSSPMENLGSGV
jgi:hypothetical protein